MEQVLSNVRTRNCVSQHQHILCFVELGTVHYRYRSTLLRREIITKSFLANLEHQELFNSKQELVRGQQNDHIIGLLTSSDADPAADASIDTFTNPSLVKGPANGLMVTQTSSVTPSPMVAPSNGVSPIALEITPKTVKLYWSSQYYITQSSDRPPKS